MNIKEAFEIVFVTGDWARPCDWKGYGQAVTYSKHKGVILVPTAHGGVPWSPSYKDLVSDWEIVDQYEVCRESE
jgi:hypothetical protein